MSRILVCDNYWDLVGMSIIFSILTTLLCFVRVLVEARIT